MTLSDYIKNHVMPILFEKFYGIPSCTDPSRILSMIPYVDYITMFDGSQFKVTKNLWCVLEESRSEYDWSDMRNTDTLLDIGAHVGTITIPAALTRVNKVIAVEPLFADELRENIRLNNLTNVTVVPFALGSGGVYDLSFFESGVKKIQTRTFRGILAMCGGKVDFLKCDCEGGEWNIEPEDLSGIRRIEMEVHPSMGNKDNHTLVEYIKANWNVKIDKRTGGDTYILHAYKR